MKNRRIAEPTPEERVMNVMAITVELLNALKYRKYRVVESGDRIVIEAAPLAR